MKILIFIFTCVLCEIALYKCTIFYSDVFHFYIQYKRKTILTSEIYVYSSKCCNFMSKKINFSEYILQLTEFRIF